jgi:hypothetical protein
MFVLKIPTETMVTYAFEYMGVSENMVYPNGYVHMESDENSLDFWVPYFQTNPYTAQSDTFFCCQTTLASSQNNIFGSCAPSFWRSWQ